MSSTSRFAFACIVSLLLAGAFGTTAAPVAAHGTTVPVVISQDERPVLDDALAVLQRYLREMTGAEVAVQPVPAHSSIYLGLFTTLGDKLPPALATELRAASDEAYAIHIDDRNVWLVGKTPLACRHAAYELLELLGCRWLAPPQAWWVIPASPNLTAAPLSVVRDPDYVYRQLRYSYGYTYIDRQTDQLLRDDLTTYWEANRLGGLTPLNFGHAYEHIIQRNRAVFDAHPEYFAMNEAGERGKRSLCYSNPEVARIFIDAKLAEFVAARERNPYARLVSMEPNDTSRPCHCEECRQLGGATDQALYLANQVASALRQQHPDGLVGILSYAPHILPPERIKPEPNIIVGIATAFNRSGLTYDDLIDAWSQHVDQMTIREYFGVVEWDFGMPGRGRGADPKYIFTKIPYWHQHGIIALDTQFNAFWASFGPATYVATKLFWDVEADAKALYDDYCRHAYGSAWRLMRDLHLSWAERRRSSVTRQDLHEWLTVVDEARRLVQDDPADVRRRMVDFMSYMHYVVLFSEWERASTTSRDAAYEALEPLLAFTWRTRTRQMTHAYALQRRLVNTGAPILRPLKEGWRFNLQDAVWRDPRPIDDGEIVALFEADLANHPADERLQAYTQQLVPWPGTEAAPTAGGRNSNKTGGTTVWYLLAHQPGQQVTLQLEEGSLGSCIVSGPSGEIITEFRRTRADDPHETSLQFELGEPGLHRVELTSMSRYYVPVFEGVQHLVAEASMDAPLLSEYWGDLCFYVPKGTREVIVAGGPRLTLKAPGWPAPRNFTPDEATHGAYHIPTDGDDGKLWTIGALTRARLYFFNVPPYVATSPAALLIPAELQAEQR